MDGPDAQSLGLGNPRPSLHLRFIAKNTSETTFADASAFYRRLIRATLTDEFGNTYSAIPTQSPDRIRTVIVSRLKPGESCEFQLFLELPLPKSESLLLQFPRPDGSPLRWTFKKELWTK